MPLTDLATLLLGRLLEPETAHALAVKALACNPPLPVARVDDARLRQRVFGLDIPNPLGLAAGFDKNAEAFEGLLRLGFGFVEVGTLTPRPQPGNPRPRLFRLREDEAIINRMGFNNCGHEAAFRRLARYRDKGGTGVIGVNIGANKDSDDRIADYAAGAARFAEVASYLTINISSPNTPGLRDLQGARELARLLDAVGEALNRAARRPPVVVKIAPDIDDEQLAAIIETSIEGGAAGLIVSNTTIARPPTLRSGQAREPGGLSGRPLFAPSTRLLAKAHGLAAGRLALIGAGGVMSGAEAWAKITAGAALAQVFTGFVYRGPGLIADILRHLAEKLEEEGLGAIDAAVGRDAERNESTINGGSHP